MRQPDELKFDDRNLIPVIAQDASSGTVLMQAWANPEAIDRTLETGTAHFWSRSRSQLWKKGETSGHEMRIRDIRVDCDADAVLYLVDPAGPACHTGASSCFHQRLSIPGEQTPPPDDLGHEILSILSELTDVIRSRRDDPSESSYTARLLSEGVPRIAKKVSEEAAETCIASLVESDDALAAESADLLYHLMVLLEARGLSLKAPCAVLRERRRGTPTTSLED